MGQGLSKKVLKRHVSEANKMEAILQQFFGDMSIRLIVLTARLLHDPREVAADFLGSVKYLLIYNPILVESQLVIEEVGITDINTNSGVVDEDKNSDSSGDDCSSRLWRDVIPVGQNSVPIEKQDNSTNSSTQQLVKKIIKCEDFIFLRRLCYEYEGICIMQHATPTNLPADGLVKAGEKRSVSFDPDECSICMDASIDIVLPCLHGYCSTCWTDWSSHSSTCPHCRGEIKEKGQDEDSGQGRDEIWQFEKWEEADSLTQRAELEASLRSFMMKLPMNFSPSVMSSHRILTGDHVTSTSFDNI
jgi:hypothetical protein